MTDRRRRWRERRVRSEERVRRAAPVRKMLSWLRERVEEEGARGVSGLDIGGRDGRWRSAMRVVVSRNGGVEVWMYVWMYVCVAVSGRGVEM